MASGRASGECVWANDALPQVLAPELRERLQKLIEDYHHGVPIADSLTSFDTEASTRPVEHWRSYYLKGLPPDNGGCIAIKGTEPLLHDEMKTLAAAMQLGLLDDVFGPGQHGCSMPDFFPVREHKIPFAVTVDEAVGEAIIGKELHGRFVARYQEVPDLPLPLAVFKWPAEVADRHGATFRPRLSRLARETVERLLAGGLGCYIYYYPGTPFPRVRHISQWEGRFPLDPQSPDGRRAAEQNIKKWTTLFVRILALGFVPAIPGNELVGQAVKEQNVVVGGGFVDLDSVTAVQDLTYSELVQSYSLSVFRLAHTIGTFVFRHRMSSEMLQCSSMEAFSYLCIFEMLSDCIDEEIRSRGNSFDKRLANLPPFNKTPSALFDVAEALPPFQTWEQMYKHFLVEIETLRDEAK